MFVSFAGPQRRRRPGTRYIAKDGTKTEIISQAASLILSPVAGELAQNHPIKRAGLTALAYAGQDGFIDSDQ